VFVGNVLMFTCRGVLIQTSSSKDWVQVTLTIWKSSGGGEKSSRCASNLVCMYAFVYFLLNL